MLNAVIVVKPFNSLDMCKCERCGKENTTTIMSMFNTDVICMDCKKEERNHPRYDEAVRADHEAIKSGNYNFEGIGYEKF